MPLDPEVAMFLAHWNSLQLPSICNQPVNSSRALLLASAQLGPTCPELAQVAERTIAGPGGELRVLVTVPKLRQSRGVVLYFHGGGWVLNSIETHDDLVRRLTAATGCVYVSVDYRLAPEHPFPAAVDDAVASLSGLAVLAREFDFDPQRVAVAGDSAGANIAAAAALASRDAGGPPVVAQVLAYPVADCDFDRPSYLEHATGLFLTRAEMQWFWDQYVPDHTQRRHPLVCLLAAPTLAGLPPSYVITAEYDPLRDEGRALAAALLAAGVEVRHDELPGMIHAFLRRAELFSATRNSIKQIGAFLALHLSL